YSAIFEEWTLAGKEIGYPLVVKPSNQKGAVGVLRIQNENELFVYYSTVRQDIYSKVYVFEQFIDGNQYSTETVLVNGHCLRHNFAYRHYAGMERFYPYLIEDGHSMPVSFSSGEKESLIEAIEKSAKALGITDGIIKGDLLIDKNGNVYVIEMASRSSGGRFADFVTPHQCGVQILYALIQIAAGDTVAVETLQEKWNIGISQRFLFLPEGKTVTTIKNADIIRSMPNVLDVVFSADFIKNRTQKKIVSHASRIGYVICRGATQQEADANALTTCELLINNME
ncbi:MAG: ATP-grasp domain-containing protein, partial [Bacteriovoracaceae bacterium]